jgi:hypothetical protein
MAESVETLQIRIPDSRFQIRILESVNLEFEINAELYAEDDPDLWTCARARETF